MICRIQDTVMPVCSETASINRLSVLWSSPVDKLIKGEVLMTTTYDLLQWLSLSTSRVFGMISFRFS